MSKYITKADGSQVKTSCFLAWGGDTKSLDLAALNSDPNLVVSTLITSGFKVARATVAADGTAETDTPVASDCVIVEGSVASLGKVVKYLADGAIKPLSADVEFPVEYLAANNINSKDALSAHLKALLGDSVKMSIHKTRPGQRHPRKPKVATDAETVSMTATATTPAAPAQSEPQPTSTSEETPAAPAAPTSPRAARRAPRLAPATTATVNP